MYTFGPLLYLSLYPIRLGCGWLSGKATAGYPARLWHAIRLGCGAQSGKAVATHPHGMSLFRSGKETRASDLRDVTPWGSSHAQGNRVDYLTHGTMPRELSFRLPLGSSPTGSKEHHLTRGIRLTPLHRRYPSVVPRLSHQKFSVKIQIPKSRQYPH